MNPILVVCFPAVGDFVRCHSAVQIIAKQYPGRLIDVVTSPIAAPLARMMPGVRQGWTLQKRHMRLGLDERLGLAKQLRDRNYEKAYLMTSSIKAALMVFAAGINERIGYPQELQFGLLNRFPSDWGKHMLAFGRRKIRIHEEVCTIASLGEKPAAGQIWPAPRLVVDPSELTSWLRQHSIDASRPALALYTAEMDNFRSWPMDRFVCVAKDFLDRGWSVRIVGGPRERSAAAQIRSAVPEAIDFTSTPSIADAMFQIASSNLFLGVDGGLSHAAAALNVPSVLIYGLNRSYPHGPVNDNVRFLEPPVSTPSWVVDTSAVSVDQVHEALTFWHKPVSCGDGSHMSLPATAIG